MVMSTRKATSFRWLKWFGWGVLGLVMSVLVLIIGIRVAYQYAWTVVGDSTVITYTVTPLCNSLQPLKQVIDSVAQKQKMKPHEKNEKIGRDTFYWENTAGIFEEKKYHLEIRLQPTDPSSEPDARTQTFYLSVVTVDSGKSDEWKKVAKDLELAITSVARVNSVAIGLDVAVYGFCTSKERPERADTGCRFEVPFPVDFKTFNENILEPRAREQKKNPKSAPNF